MIFYSLINRHNLHASTKFFKSATSRYYTLCRLKNFNFGNMSQKINQNKTYVAITVPQNSTNTSARRLPSFLRRGVKTNNATIPMKKSEVGRLFSLAKKEKWSIFGKLNFACNTIHERNDR